MKPRGVVHLFGSRVAFSENKHKVCPIEHNLLFGVDVGVIYIYMIEDIEDL